MLENWISSQWQKKSPITWLLLPLSWIYLGVSTFRRQLYRLGICRTYKAPVPVVVVGNIYVGGTGKTPVILSLIDALRARGWHPGLVSRGYGSVEKAEPACGMGAIDARIFGDEPTMISHKTQIPVSVHANRAAACQALLQYAPDVDIILSDDGLQHWPLARDIEILVQDDRGCGNGFVMPAGPLREPASRLRHVDAILTRSSPQHLGSSQLQSGILRSQFAVQVQHFVHLRSGSRLSAADFIQHLHGTGNATAAQQNTGHSVVLAIAGIGVPARFFNDLSRLGIGVDRTLALPDHGSIEPAWIAKQPERTILMTDKDAARLMQAYAKPADSLQSEESGNAQQPFSEEKTLHCTQADSRIWVGVARTHWPDNGLFDWLDQRLRQRPGV